MTFIRSHRWVWLLAVAALAAGLVVVAGVGRGGAPAAAADTATADTVSVTGVGAANGAPDTLTVDFTVHVNRGDVQSALDAQAAATRRVLAALHRDGVDSKHLQTTDLELNRRYDNHGTPIGYAASETIEARITPLTHVGRTISDAAASSPSNVDVGDIGFDIAKDAPLLAEARSSAYADAKSRAQQYATLSGRTLGRVERITETVHTPRQPSGYDHMAFSAATDSRLAAVPIKTGQQALSVEVTVVWQLT